MMARVLYPPERLPAGDIMKNVCVFLAGSIEMGSAIDWQAEVIKHIDKDADFIFNPRRKVWDPSWKQDISNEVFREQVDWELDHIESADVVFFYFAPGTQSPISLMELGFCLGRDWAHVIVVCPPGYWRRGNVQIMCDRGGIKMYDDLFDGLQAFRDFLEGY